MMYRSVLDPANLHENGKTPAFVPFVSGSSSDGYWNVGSGARWKWTTDATMARIRIYSNQATSSASQLQPNFLGYRVNGYDYWAGASEQGEQWLTIVLPHGLAKTFELFVPTSGIVVIGSAILGAWPIEIQFNAPFTVIAPSGTGTHRIIYGDSIATGRSALAPTLQSFSGLMKRGVSDSALPSTSVPSRARYKGTYLAGTLYAVNDVVTYNGSTWQKLTLAAAGTTPVAGTDWKQRGFVGKVTTVAYGFRRLIDDCSNSSAQTAFAMFIASLNPTQLTMLIGTNDWVAGWSASSFQMAYTGFLDALAGTSASGCAVQCVSPLLTSGREGMNSFNNTMDDYRAAVQAAVAATAKTGVTFVNGKTILALADMEDGLHPNTSGHYALRAALG